MSLRDVKNAWIELNESGMFDSDSLRRGDVNDIFRELEEVDKRGGRTYHKQVHTPERAVELAYIFSEIGGISVEQRYQTEAEMEAYRLENKLPAHKKLTRTQVLVLSW